MNLSCLFDDAFRREVELIIQDSTLSDDTLHNNAERYLQVLADPSCTDIDQPAWIRRIQRSSLRQTTYTSSKLFDALYRTADAGLTLAGGKRYVSATICVCASHAERCVLAASFEDRRRGVAEALSQLASVWIAFMLWPFFVDGLKFAEEVLVSPRCGPPLPEATSTGSQNSNNDRRWAIKEGLLKRSGYVCFMTGYVYFRAPPKFFHGEERVSISDLRVTHILRPPSALRSLGMRNEDEVVTSDILSHYCGSICANDVDLGADGVTEARNSLLMEASTCSAFSSFRWCLHPCQVANQYQVEVHQRNWFGTQYVASPNPVTFEDHSHEFSSAQNHLASASPISENPPSPCAHNLQRNADIDLPSTELLRVHAALAGVLQLSGAMTAFEAILYTCEALDKTSLPGASGSTFLRSVVAYEGQQVCVDVERLGIRARKWESSDSGLDSDSDSD